MYKLFYGKQKQCYVVHIIKFNHKYSDIKVVSILKINIKLKPIKTMYTRKK